MPQMINSLGTLAQHIAAFPWPADFFSADDLPGFLDRIHVVGWERQIDGFRLAIAFEAECAVKLPGLDGVQLVLGGSAVEGVTVVETVVRRGEPSTLTFENIRVAIRFSRDLLQPAPDDDGNVAEHAEIYVEGAITIDDQFDLHIDGFNAIQLTPVMIGSSGIVLSASDVKLDLSRTSSIPEVLAAGFDDSFLGVYIGEAKVVLPPGFPALAPEDLILRTAAIGSGGVSGTLEATYNPTFDPATSKFTGRGAGELFGVPFGLHEVDLSLKANAFERARMAGELLLPFFDGPVMVDLGVTHTGDLTVAVSSDDGLVTINKPGVVEVEVASLGFEITSDKLTAHVSGKIKPLIGGLDWPAFQVENLAIDSDGNVKLDGGWLDLPDQYALDFHGFALEISKIGFGKTDDGGKWIGFGGGLSFAAQLRAGASVEGLRVIWYSDGRGPRVTLDGVSVQLDVPDVVRFDGRVAYKELEVDGQTVHRFDGAIKLELLAIDMTVDGQLVVGRAGGQTFLAIDCGFELPAGIPLFSTGLALYGMEGLFALGMEPDRHDEEPWYDWYKRAPIGATKLEKWTNRAGSLAFGAGVTVGTAADNGYTFASKATFAIIFPGPVIVIEGKANILKKRTTLVDEPMFRALAVLDKRTDTFLVGLDAQYRYDDDGKVIDIAGGAEAMFRLSSADDWHVYLGQRDPREKRIRANVLSLVQGDSYFMIDPHELAMGASAGWSHNWKFGPLRVSLEAWLEANAALSRKPTHFHGDAWLHGKAGLKVYGHGVDVSVDAKLAADVTDPFHVLGEFTVGIGLPWPLPDFDVDISLEWGPEPTFPALPAPLEEVAVEHFKVTTSWPLALGDLLVPRLDRGDGMFDAAAPTPAAPLTAPIPASAPVVPLDARPHVTFARAMNDDALVGVNGRETDPEYEPLGDPSTGEGPVHVRFGLREVALERWAGATWELAARSVGPMHPTQNPPGMPRLYGSWAPMPALPDLGGDDVAQVKLWLWSKTPFSWSRGTGGEWNEWFSGTHDDYPCPDIPPREVVCWDIEGAYGDQLARPWVHPDEPELRISWLQLGPLAIVPVVNDDQVTVPGLCIPSRYVVPATHGAAQNAFVIQFPVPNVGVRLGLRDPEKAIVGAMQADGTVIGAILGGAPDPVVEIAGTDVRYAVIVPRSRACLYRVCVVRGLTDDEIEHRQDLAQHMREELDRWSQEDNVLEPDRAYRLRIATTVDAIGDGELAGTSHSVEHVQLAYFRTAGPPGLAQLSPPSAGELDDLRLYVRQTTPPTVPPNGTPPVRVGHVYRAYDLGVAFDENYVELMYRLADRDLGMYVFDANDRPARDADGRLLAGAYRWDLTPDAPLTDAEAWWTTQLQTSTCASFDESTIIHDTALASSGHVLAPDLQHEVRLVPLLLHDDFTDLATTAMAIGTGAMLGSWVVADGAATGAPGRWAPVDEAMGRALAQSASVGDASLPGDAHKPGTLLRWTGDATDARTSVYVRSASGGGIGLAVRAQSATRHLLFVMDRVGGYRRLVRVFDDEWTILAEDDFVYAVDRDYLVQVETIGSEVRVFVDGARVFEATDPSFASGGIALYAWRCPDARFKDVRIDDLGAGARVLYRFAFTTSPFANFTHHLHSHQGAVWDAPAIDPTLLAPAVSPTSPPSDDEARAYEAAAAAALGASPPPATAALQVTRVAGAGLLLQSAEPIDWRRLTVQAAVSARLMPAPVPPATELSPVLIEAAWGELTADRERITVFCRDVADQEALRVERYGLPGCFEEGEGDDVVFDEPFPGEPTGILLEERFGANALDQYRVIDEGTNAGPSVWRVVGGTLRQTSNVWGGDVSGAVAAKPGTLAITGDPGWSDVRVSATLRSLDDDLIGITVRCDETGTGYRFVMDAERSYRRLLKITPAATTVLWEDDVAYVVGIAYRVVVEAYGALLVVWIDDAFVCAVVDGELAAGRVGLCCWANQDARWEALRVESLAESPLLALPSAADVSAWTAVELESTTLIGGDDAWDDVAVSAILAAVPGEAVGLLIRSIDGYNHYRLVIDPSGGRSLIRRLEGTDVVLWHQTAALVSELAVTLRAIGPLLSLIVGGQILVVIDDETFATGGVGMLGTGVSRLAVANARRRVARWRVVDEGTVAGPSAWSVGPTGLRQRSGIRSTSAVDPAQLGTTLVGGAPPVSDARIEVVMHSDADGAIGVVFRWMGPSDYYRLLFDRAAGYRRLIRKQAGVVTTLWETAGSYQPGSSFRVLIDLIGSRLVGRLDGELLFDLRDEALGEGALGLYASNSGACFERLIIRRLPLSAYVLFADRFATGSLAGWTSVDEGTAGGPSNWACSDGSVHQTSNIYSLPLDGWDPAKAGTQLIAGDTSWSDVVVSVRLLSKDDDALGLAFRCAAPDRFYRFSMDRERGYRRLVKRVGAAVSVLWEAPLGYELDRVYELSISAVGSRLFGCLDGIPMFDIEDDELISGRIALYTWANQDARFAQVRVHESVAAFRSWDVDDPFVILGGFRWSFAGAGTWRAMSGGATQDGGGEAFAIAKDGPADDRRIVVGVQLDEGRAGVVSAWSNPNDHVRCELDVATSQVRLIAVASGAQTKLAEVAWSPILGRDCVLTVDHVGTHVRCAVDGEPLISVDNAPPAHGAAALYTGDAIAPKFRRLRIGRARWMPYGAPAGKTVGAGSRLTVAPYDGARLVEPDARLRLLVREAARLQVLHERSFLPASAFADLPVRVLRRGDGTGILVAAALSSGELRLIAEYARSGIADAPALSEAGDPSPERTVFDVRVS